ncbi:MAG: hypothetical protein M4579_007307, partial [Chaenotheca gracillima]
LNFACGFTSLSDTDAVLNATKTFVRRAREYTQSEHQFLPFLYSNYALPSQDPIASYGRASQARLRAVARRYDPQQVFQRLVPGGFKLYRDERDVCC